MLNGLGGKEKENVVGNKKKNGCLTATIFDKLSLFYYFT